MKGLWILFLLLATQGAFAAGDFDLTADCKASLKKTVLERELHHLRKMGESLASAFKAEVRLSYWPERDDVSVGVYLEDPVDGRSISYGQRLLKSEAAKCDIHPRRRPDTACRYSRPDGGPEELTSIPGITFKSGRTIRPNSHLNALEEAQIRQFLDSDNSGTPIADLIGATDEGELTSGTVTLPDFTRLTYYGAYGGDNPYGVFFVEGRIDGAGANSDGSVCIRPLL